MDEKIGKYFFFSKIKVLKKLMQIFNLDDTKNHLNLILRNLQKII